MTKSIEFSVNQIRQDFPLLQRQFCFSGSKTGSIVYLDNAATTQKPRQVIDTLVRYYEEENANVHRALYTLGEMATKKYEQSRKTIAKFLGAKEREIVFTRGATEAINLVASSWGKKFLCPGQSILLSEMEHHSNLIPWQMLAKEKNLRLQFLPFGEKGTLDLSNLESLLKENVGLVAVTHASNVFGSISPVEKIIFHAHQRNIPVLLDGAQSVPHLAVDVQKLDCDFLVFSGHKMCGPTGIGVLYAKEKWLEEMPPYQGGGDMIASVWLDRATYNEIPFKWEAGTPNIAGAIGLACAVEYIFSLGMENIYNHEQRLTSYAISRLKKIKGLKLFGADQDRLGVISFSLEGIHPHDVAQFLDTKGIALRAGHHCAQPIMRKLGIPATLRASFYFYNTLEEVDCLEKGLQEAKEFF